VQVIYSVMRPEETITMPPSKWERVADAIRGQIRSGQLRPGDRLPSIAQLQAIHGVSYGPIRTATLILKAEGWVYGQPGEGVYVTADPPIG
jgi:DNA-binding GntR family transcriptional regulator